MLWAALLPELDPSTDSPRSDVLAGIATWALQFSPRVAVVESSEVVVEVSASTRLFGGRRKLAQRIREEGAELGLRSPSWAPTSLAALGLARAGLIDGMPRPLQDVVDALPITVLSAVVKHQAMLARLGCRTIGDVRALPRGGISRRFEAEVLAEMDQAYGLRPESHAWVVLPDTFSARIELMHRVDQAPAMLLGARRLLLQLCGWLAARRSGVTAFTLRYAHDVMRARDAGEGGELTVRTAQATRNVEHLTRLLMEHLARVQLAAPVGDLQLLAPEVHSLEEKSAGLLPDPAEDSEGLSLVLERVAARRAMAAWKRHGGLEKYRAKLVNGMLQNGYERSFAEGIFEQIKGFGEYGFPESHAACIFRSPMDTENRTCWTLCSADAGHAVRHCGQKGTYRKSSAKRGLQSKPSSVLA